MSFNLEDLDGLDPSEYDAVLQELEKLTKDDPWDYRPHDKQLKFHQNDKYIRAIFGGNRTGKTEAGTMEAWYHASGDYPSWYPAKHKFPSATKGRIIITDYKTGGKNMEEKLKKWFPAERTKIKKFMGHIESIYVTHKTGGTSVIDVLTHEQADMVFEGWSGHWAWFDEPPPREKYVATTRGLIDYGGFLWMTLTPISEPWLYDEVVTREDGLAWYITVDINDNPYLTEEYIKNFAASLSEDEKEARLRGNFRHLAGRVYKDFQEDIHVIPAEKANIDKTWPVWFVLDPADRRPHHGIWFTVNPLNTVYVFDEIVFKGTIKETSREILQRERLMGINPMNVIRVLDPNKGRTPSAVSGLKLVDEFASHAVYFSVSVNDDVTLGHLAVAEKLAWNKKEPLSSTNCPKLYFIKDKTKEMVRQLLSYVWDDWKGNSKGSKSEKEKPKDINKDMPDCLRYGIVFNPRWYDMRDTADPTPYAGQSWTHATAKTSFLD